jgi:hypothetical protein
MNSHSASLRTRGALRGLATLIILAVTITAAGAAEPSSIRLVRVPGGGIQPQVQTDERGRVHMIYFTGDPARGDVYYVRSDDGGSTFTTPLLVNSQPQSAIAIGTVRGPHLALGKKGRIHVAWMGSDRAVPKIDGKAVPMLYARLNDAGDGFEPQRNVIQKYAGLDGGGAVAADADGNVYVAWHAPRSQANEADRHVWVSRSRDEGKTFEPETLAIQENTGACGCCGMNITAGSDGRIYILFRSATEQVHRDMYLLASNDQAATFQTIAKDPWNIGICAMSTSGFAPAGDGIVAAWETQNQIRFTRVKPDGLANSDVSSVPGNGGNRKHPAVAVNKRGEFIVAWAEGTGWSKGGAVAWQVFDREGNPRAGQSGRADGLPIWDSPAAFAARDDSFKIVF